jgi:hypothetical protein
MVSGALDAAGVLLSRDEVAILTGEQVTAQHLRVILTS